MDVTSPNFAHLDVTSADFADEDNTHIILKKKLKKNKTKQSFNKNKILENVNL